MDSEQVIQDLARRFSAPLPEFYRRRIIFWYDEEREFEDQLDGFELPGVKLARLTGTNTFSVKKLLSADDADSDFLVYQPFGYDDPEEDWLLDVKLYSEEFRADLLSIWMEEMHIAAAPALRKTAREYRKFFGEKRRRAKVAALAEGGGPSSPSALHLAVMAALSAAPANPGAVIRAVLSAGPPLLGEFAKYGADKAFWTMVRQGTGYHEEAPALDRLAAHILLTASTRTMPALPGLEAFISTPHQSYCYDFISDWLHSGGSGALYELARSVEEELRLPQRLEGLRTADIEDTECFPCVNACILKRLMGDVAEHLVDVESITALVEKRRAFVWYDTVRHYFEGLLQIAHMWAFYKEHAAGFHMAEPHKVWKEYTDTYYKMDACYRQFHLNFIRSLDMPDPALDDLFKRDAEVVEGLYKRWFLGELGRSWTAVCADDLREYGKIQGVSQQTDFYREYVKGAGSRIFVIISDALRYETAASLWEQLSRETQARVELSSMQGVFPTITKFGMAALLPHKELAAAEKNGRLCVLADGLPTEGSAYRDKLLKRANPGSVALLAEDMVKARREERSEWVKGKNVVYIYHNVIDEASHTADTAVFPACEGAIQQIKNLVGMIVNNFGGTNIVITADHGFLYTYSPLSEDDKTDTAGFHGFDVEYGRRYAVTRAGAEPEYLLPVKFLEGKTDYQAFTPRESVRIKMSGGGLNFVHGGVSLQEMVVPVISYHFLRNDSKEYRHNRGRYDTKPVSIGLLSVSRKISNMTFALSFYQKEAVSENREKASYLLYFADSSGRQISGTQKIIADRTSREGQERTFRCTFNLKPLPFHSTEVYYLVIADEGGAAPPQREEFQIDIASAVDEVNFF